MAMKTYDVILNDGVDSTDFTNSFSSNANVELKNPMVSMPTLLVMKVEDSYLDTFKDDSRVSKVETPEPGVTPLVIPGFTSVGPKKLVTAGSDTSTSNDGSDYMPLQMYLDQDTIEPSKLNNKTAVVSVYSIPSASGQYFVVGADINGDIRSANPTINLKEGNKIQIYAETHYQGGIITGVSGGSYQINFWDRNTPYEDGAASVADPTYNIEVGDSIDFINTGSTSGHPFYFKTAATTGTGDQVTTGTTYGQGSNSASQYGMQAGWDTGSGPTVVPGTYYYQCSNHSGMGGQIIVHAAGTLHNHPVYLKTAATTGTGDLISGATGQGANLGSDDPATYTFPLGSAGTYYYQCSLHSGMGGQIIVTAGDAKIGNNPSDTSTYLSDVTYTNRWTGKYVDMVTCETTDDFRPANDHTSHADFDDLDSPGTSRVIPVDWPNLSATHNNQVTNGNELCTNHGMGVLSVAGGTICGYAKKAKLYQTTWGGGDDIVEQIDSVVTWHNAKSVNGTTGLKNPTIIIGEVQWLKGRRIAYKIEDINTIKTPSGDVTRPGAGWGTDFTPFTSRHMIPFQVKDPVTSTWHWCMVIPERSEYGALNTAIDNAWDAGVVMIMAAGNDGGCYVKNSDARYSGDKFVIDPGSDVYTNTVDYDSNGNWIVDWSKSTTDASNNETHNVWYNHGMHGRDKAIEVAAGQNSETWPILDTYTNRGPGIDIVGRGASTWSSWPVTTYADGKKWGWFSGTSCATPTVAGKAACLMEEYMTLNNAWPTPAQVKELLLSEQVRYQESWDGRRIGLMPSQFKLTKSGGGFDWTSVGTASTHKSSTTASGSGSINKMQDGTGMNGSVAYIDHAGTTRKFACIDTKCFNRNHTRGPRPKEGGVYPRPRITRHDNKPEFP